MTLAKRVRALEKALPRRVNDQTKEVAVKVLDGLIASPPAGTPIDTSKALSNWQIGLGRAVRSYIKARVAGKAGSSGGASRARTRAAALAALVGRKIGQMIYITNNAPYIRKLAYDGHSKQSPPGWVEGAVLVARKYLKAISSKLLNGL